MSFSSWVVPSLPLPKRPDGWRTVRSPDGLSIRVEHSNEVRFDLEDASHKPALRALAEALAQRTAGVLVWEDTRLQADVDDGARTLYRALTESVDADAERRLVREAFARVQGTLVPRANRQGYRKVADEAVRALAKAQEGDDEAEPEIRLGKPCGQRTRTRLAKAIAKKTGMPLPAGLDALLSSCNGIEGSWFTGLPAIEEVFAHLEDGPVIPLGPDGEGPALLFLSDRALVVDAWHEAFGNEHGEGWPVLGTSVGAWFEDWCERVILRPDIGQDALALTPPLLEWTNDNIQSYWSRALAGEFSRRVQRGRPRELALAALAAGNLEDAVEHARQGQLNPPDWPRATAILVTALRDLGRRDEARALLAELVRRWLDDAPAPPPQMHPRVALEKEELASLLGSLDVPGAAKIVGCIEAAGPIEVDGDVL